MIVYTVYRRPGYDKMTNDHDEFAAGEWHYCGSFAQEKLAQERADDLVEEGSSVRLLTSELDPVTSVEQVIEFGMPVYRGVAQLRAEQEMKPIEENTSPITQSPDNSPSMSRLSLAPFDLADEDWSKLCSWV